MSELFIGEAPPLLPTNWRLRPYQQRAREAVLEEFKEHQSTLLVMATGTGKTITFADMAAEFAPLGRVMVLVHLDELAHQAREKIEAATGMTVAIEMGSDRADHDRFTRSQVVVSTWQTQNAGEGGAGRRTRFDPNKFSFLICDEAHHYVAGSPKKVVDYYRHGNPELKVLGVTATPDRQDEKALGNVFESVAMVYEPLEAIEDGWLCPLSVQSVFCEHLDFSAGGILGRQAKKTAGDINKADLQAVMEYEDCLHEVLSPTIEIADGRQTLIFASGLNHAERMVEILHRHGPNSARWIHHKTKKPERRAIFKDFRAGEFQFLVNVGIVTEGVDVPGLEVVAIARPTQSRALLAQMIGRVTRTEPGIVDAVQEDMYDDPAAERRRRIAGSKKPYGLVLDFVGNCGPLKLITPTHVLGGDYEDDVLQRAASLQLEIATEEPRDVIEILNEAKKQIREEHKLEEERKRSVIKPRAKYSLQSRDVFNVVDIEPRRSREWDNQSPLSAKERGILEKQGIDPDGFKPEEARQVMKEIFRRWKHKLASPKQAKHLKKLGLPGDLPAAVAKQVMNVIAANKFKPLKKDQVDAVHTYAVDHVLERGGFPTDIPDACRGMLFLALGKIGYRRLPAKREQKAWTWLFEQTGEERFKGHKMQRDDRPTDHQPAKHIKKAKPKPKPEPVDAQQTLF